jgi:hypothetical protein
MEPASHGAPAGFVAFASGSPALAETLETAAQDITRSGVADLITWQSLQIGGRLLLSTICDAITQRQLFVADVSALNPNVLFELGFAIAQQKRIWLLLDSTQMRPRSEFARFQLLTTVGYREFANSRDVLRLFLADRPYASLEKTVYNDIFDTPGRHLPSLLSG